MKKEKKQKQKKTGGPKSIHGGKSTQTGNPQSIPSTKKDWNQVFYPFYPHSLSLGSTIRESEWPRSSVSS